MQLRRWAREAPTDHVVGGVFLAVLLLAGAVLVAIPVGEDGDTAVDSAGLPANPALSTTGAAPSTPLVEGNGEVASGTAAEGPASVGGPGVDSVAAPAAVEGSAPGAEGAGAAEAPVASDVGVTKTEIKIGIVKYNVGGISATGFALGIRPDLDEVIDAIVAAENAAGGVHGRKIVYVKTEQDPLDNNSQRQACIKMAADEKVFTAFEAGSTIGVNAECYPEHRLPFFYGSPQTNSSASFSRAGGFLVSVVVAGTRALLNWASFALEDGWIKSGEKLGILDQECPPGPEMVDKVFVPHLKEAGVKPMVVRLSCDLNTAQQQIPGAVLQFRQAGITKILPAVIFTHSLTFYQQAQAQGYHPEYSCSDMWGLCQDLFNENNEPDQFDGTVGYTDTHSGEEKAGKPYNAGVQRCSKIFTDAGLDPVTNQMGRDAAAISLCDHIHLWATAMRNGPVNPTRQTLIDQVTRIGDWPTAYADRAVFGPGKFEGGDSYAKVQWSKGCKCFTQIRPHQPARF